MNFAKTEIVKSIQNLKVKLGVSKMPGAGIGVFALVDIPPDTSVFSYRNADHFIPWEDVQGAPMVVQKYIAQMTTCVLEDQTFIIDVPADLIYSAYYINHSTDPNVFWDRNTDEMYTIVPVKAGDELTTYYRPDERDWL